MDEIIDKRKKKIYELIIRIMFFGIYNYVFMGCVRKFYDILLRVEIFC